MDLLQYFNSYLNETKDDWNYITPVELYNQLKKNPNQYFLLDVRKKKDYLDGHIAGTTNIFWLELFQNKNIKKLPKNKKIVVICYVGHTSSQAITLLKLLGYDAIALKFGMGRSPVMGVPVAGWLDYGYPIETHCN